MVEKEGSELRLSLKHNLQANSLESYLVKNSQASYENSFNEVPPKAQESKSRSKKFQEDA
jgi:hypothetical protein